MSFNRRYLKCNYGQGLCVCLGVGGICSCAAIIWAAGIGVSVSGARNALGCRLAENGEQYESVNFYEIGTMKAQG